MSKKSLDWDERALDINIKAGIAFTLVGIGILFALYLIYLFGK
jgi:hypothetical protein